MPQTSPSQVLPHINFSANNETYRWCLYSDRVEVDQKVVEKVDGRTKKTTTLISCMYLCKPDTDNTFSPQESEIAPITDRQIHLTKDRGHQTLLAERMKNSGSDYFFSLLQVAHDQYVTCFCLEEMVDKESNYSPEWVFDNDTQITRIGFADPQKRNEEAEQFVDDDTPLCVVSAGEIVYLDTWGDPD